MLSHIMLNVIIFSVVMRSVVVPDGGLSELFEVNILILFNNILSTPW
jgi:hypothetical protein